MESEIEKEFDTLIKKQQDVRAYRKQLQNLLQERLEENGAEIERVRAGADVPEFEAQLNTQHIGTDLLERFNDEFDKFTATGIAFENGRTTIYFNKQ